MCISSHALRSSYVIKFTDESTGNPSMTFWHCQEVLILDGKSLLTNPFVAEGLVKNAGVNAKPVTGLLSF